MPMKYDPDTGKVSYEIPPAIELEEGVTPQPDVITSKSAFFKGDGPKTVTIPKDEVISVADDLKRKAHIPIERDFDSPEIKAALDAARPGHLDYRVATDAEIAEVEQLANSRSVFHWPILIAIINRLREAERKLASR